MNGTTNTSTGVNDTNTTMGNDTNTTSGSLVSRQLGELDKNTCITSYMYMYSYSQLQVDTMYKMLTLLQ